jgi:predicted transcriptional regulator
MAKKPLSVEIPKRIKERLDRLNGKTTWPKNLLVSLTLDEFLNLTREEQEGKVREFLERGGMSEADE